MKKHIIQFSISRGDTHYVATGVDLPVVTQGSTLDELVVNLQEAISLHFEGEDLANLDFASQPSVLANFEIPSPFHA